MRFFLWSQPIVSKCSIPDDHIDPRRSALFMARSILRGVRDGDATCHMSRGNRDIQRSTAARPGTRVTPCRSDTANGSRRPSVGPRPSAAWPRPSIGESNGCVRASSLRRPQTTAPDCPGCLQPDHEEPRQACIPSAQKNSKPNAAGCAE